MVRAFREKDKPEELNVGELDEKAVSAVDSDIRKDIISLIAEGPTFPAEVSRKLELGKQRTYYHFRLLEDAEIIEKVGEKTFSGGTAQLFDLKNDLLALDLGKEGKKTYLPAKSRSLDNFLAPMISEGEIKGKIVVGSSEPHGEDQVRAQDGHLSAEIAAKLGNHGRLKEETVVLDTELKMTDNYNQNLIVLGGILTNTVAKRFNGEFPVTFSGEDFPYREIETPEKTYDGSRIGFIAKTEHPDDSEKAVYVVAGVRREGTRAAVKAFKDIENIVEGYETGDFYTVVEGIDRSGDGTVDSYELRESGF